MGQEPHVAVDMNGLRLYESFQMDETIHIDGLLDEKEWKNAEFQGDFVQREPNVHEPATESTKIAILRSGNFCTLALNATIANRQRSLPGRCVAMPEWMKMTM